VPHRRRVQEHIWFDSHSKQVYLCHHRELQQNCTCIHCGETVTVHKRGDTDRKAILKFVHWYLHGLLDRDLDPTLIFFSEERRFNFSAGITGTVLQDIRCWSTKCSMVKLVSGVLWVQRGLLHSFFWCGTIFLKKDSAAAHNHMQFCAFTKRFWDSIIRGLWPRSPDLNTCLWSYWWGMLMVEETSHCRHCKSHWYLLP